jgi:hypothetical protein
MNKNEVKKDLYDFNMMISTVNRIVIWDNNLTNDHRYSFLTNVLITYYIKNKGYPLSYNIEEKCFKVVGPNGNIFTYDYDYDTDENPAVLIKQNYECPKVNILLKAFKHFRSLETDKLYKELLPFENGYKDDDIIRLVVNILNDSLSEFLLEPVDYKNGKLKIRLLIDKTGHTNEYEFKHPEDVFHDLFNIFNYLYKLFK